eukprot:1138871-Pelagomonas_calceolata.AAC.1
MLLGARALLLLLSAAMRPDTPPPHPYPQSPLPGAAAQGAAPEASTASNSSTSFSCPNTTLNSITRATAAGEIGAGAAAQNKSSAKHSQQAQINCPGPPSSAPIHSVSSSSINSHPKQ